MFLILFLIGSKLRLFHTVYGLSPNNFCHRTILPVNLVQRNVTISMSGVKYFVLSKSYQLTKQSI